MKGLYIHIPFCVKKCEYCDFVSFSGMDARHDAYIDMLIREMEAYRGENIDTVFIGGGTPTALSSKRLTRLLAAVRKIFPIARETEFTVEVNPGTATEDKISALLSGGVDRVSVGVQSFNDAELKAIGRIHDARTAYTTVIRLKAAGFNNISIDLMASLPYQTIESFNATLDTALSLPITHISVYSLIIEDGTPIQKKYQSGIYKMPDEDTDRQLYRLTGELLSSRGFNRYEISNYARAGFESRHNLKYWNCDEYIGVGLAAHSYINGVRYYNTSDMTDYLSGKYRAGEEILSDTDKRGEFMILGLRKIEGISEAVFGRRFGMDIESVYGDIILKYANLGVLEKADGFVRLTERGLDVANTVMSEFV
ncbi:MAG: radical SAM family heme chaperone HemW [Clostridia bacterium]|nr:radical SAM family heme chaperone HemW [Clostridia bacterium]